MASSSRPPLPTRCSSADRSSSGSLISMQRSTSVERSLMMVNSIKPPTAPMPPPPHSNSVHVIGFHNNEHAKDTSSLSPSHYAVPKASAAAATSSASANKVRIQLVPDFHKGKHDMGEFTQFEKLSDFINFSTLLWISHFLLPWLGCC